jgi:hypothetical protein
MKPLPKSPTKGAIASQENALRLEVQMVDRVRLRVSVCNTRHDLLRESKSSRRGTESRPALQRTLGAVLRNQEGLPFGRSAVFQCLQDVRMIQSHARFDFALEVVLSLGVYQALQNVLRGIGLVRASNHERVTASGGESTPIAGEITHCR